MKSKDLPPGPSWSKALAVIRQHDPETAEALKWKRGFVLDLLGEGFKTKEGRLLCLKVFARLESQALDLYEQLRRGGYDLDRCSVVEGPYTEAMEAGADERSEHHRHLIAAPDCKELPPEVIALMENLPECCVLAMREVLEAMLRAKRATDAKW